MADDKNQEYETPTPTQEENDAAKLAAYGTTPEEEQKRRDEAQKKRDEDEQKKRDAAKRTADQKRAAEASGAAPYQTRSKDR